MTGSRFDDEVTEGTTERIGGMLATRLGNGRGFYAVAEDFEPTDELGALFKAVGREERPTTQEEHLEMIVELSKALDITEAKVADMLDILGIRPPESLEQRVRSMSRRPGINPSPKKER